MKPAKSSISQQPADLLRFMRGGRLTGLESSPPMFLVFIRLLVLFGIIGRFWIHRGEYSGTIEVALLVSLFVLAIYTLSIALTTWRAPALHQAKQWSRFQVICDIVLFTVLYWFTGTPQSDFFLFFFLPIFVAADSLSDTDTFVSFLAVSFALLVVVLVLINQGPPIGTQSEFSTPEAVVRIFLPRVTFYLAVLYLAFVQRTRIKLRTAQLTTLRDIDIRINQHVGDARSLQIVVEECLRFFQAESCHIRLREGATLRLVAGVGSYYKVAPQIVPLDAQILSGSAHAYMSTSPYIVQNADEDDFFRGFRDQVGDRQSRVALQRIHSFGCFPLEFGEEIIGVLTLKFVKSRAFSVDVCETIEDFGRRAATAIYTAHLLEETRRRLQDSERLLQVNKEITPLSPQSDHPRRVLQTVIKAAVDAIPQADKGSIFFLDRQSGTLRIVANQGYSPEVVDSLVFKVGEGIVGRAVQTGVATVVSDFGSDPRAAAVNTGQDTDVIKSCACVPISGPSGLIGGICLDSTQQTNAFSEPEVQLLLAYAGQASIAIENAVLYDTARRQAAVLSALNEIGYTISAMVTLRPEEVIGQIFKKVNASKLMDVTNFYVATYDWRQDTVHFVFAVEDGQEAELGIGEWQSRVCGNGLTEYLIQTEKPTLIAENVERWLASNNINVIGRLAKSWLGVPIIAEGVVLGAMAVQNYEKEYAYDETHLQVLSTIASQTGAMLQNHLIFKSLQSTRDHLSAVVISSPDAVIAIDKSGRVTTFSQSSEELLNIPRNEIEQQPADSLFWGGKNDLKRIIAEVSDCRNKRLESEIFMRSRTGERIPVYLTAAPIYDDQRQVIGIIGVLRDLRLRALKGRTRALFDAIASIDSHTNVKEIEETVMLEALSLFGAQTGCLLVREGDSLVPRIRIGSEVYLPERPLSRDKTVGIESALRDKTSLTISRSDSTDIYLPLSQAGQCELMILLGVEEVNLGVLVLESQIDDYFKAADTELADLADVLARQASIAISRAQLSETQERAQRALLRTANTVAAGQIAVGVAHEVKNGLNNMALGISSLSDSLQKEAGIRNKRKYTDELDSVSTEILRLSRLAQQLQRFSQRIEPQKAECYLNTIVREAEESMRGTLGEHDMTCDLRLAPALDAPPGGTGGHPARVDERQIRQVIMNLVLNAIDASNPRSKITIRTELQGSEVVLQVSDYGKGINPEEKRQLFQPFYSTKPQGTGLGLYVCKLIVEDNHQGKLDLESRSGKGTTFSIRIPLR